MEDTQRGRYQFRLTNYSDRTPWIMTDPLEEKDRLKVFGNGFIGFDLKPGTTQEEAHRIALFLGEHIGYITFTA
jgi:hypothetical protein